MAQADRHSEKPLQKHLKVLAAALGLALITSAWFGLIAAKQPESSEPWPPLVLEYRQQWYPEGPGGPLADETYRLEYQNKRSWRLGLLSSSYRPEAVGE